MREPEKMKIKNSPHLQLSKLPLTARIKGSLKFLFKSKSDHLFLVSDEEKAKLIIKSSLTETIGASDFHDINNLTDKLYCKLVSYDKKSLKDRFFDLMKSTHPPQLSTPLWYYSQLCGLSCIWEFHVKMFAESLKIDIKKPMKNRSRKNKNIESLVYQNMSFITKQIKEKLKYLNIEFKRVLEIRSALVHGNFQQLSVLMTNPSKNKRKIFGNNLIEYNLENLNQIHYSRPLRENELKGTRLFAWFLDRANDQLTGETLNFFYEEISKVNLLTDFKDHFSNDCGGLFEKIFIEGEDLSRDDKEAIKAILTTSPLYRRVPIDKNKYILDVCDLKKTNSSLHTIARKKTDKQPQSESVNNSF